ncbi:hypothetical protein [Methylobacterium sp. Leaf91]|uniref:hypothetical protein n=1 Tax=Methylobacterium sp. Leaf91 TaxID=1736247 RepID=UPI000701016F|nr:hypothetical protein [Methylobacterium sp. Leaf91]KQO94617.1 hypothetical protein ASF32_19060 [Methylobacterium sp. Leaf91]
MSVAPRTLADTGISGLIVDRETFTSQDVFNAGFDARQEGISLGMTMAALDQATHAHSAASTAVSRIVRHLPKAGPMAADAIRTREMTELAAQFRALADALEAAAKSPAPALREAA